MIVPLTLPVGNMSKATSYKIIKLHYLSFYNCMSITKSQNHKIAYSMFGGGRRSQINEIDSHILPEWEEI